MQIICSLIVGLFSIIIFSLYINSLDEISLEENKYDLIDHAIKNSCFEEINGIFKAADVLKNHFGESNSEVFIVLCIMFGWSLGGFILWTLFYLMKIHASKHN